jgi:hypothetical protein
MAALLRVVLDPSAQLMAGKGWHDDIGYDGIKGGCVEDLPGLVSIAGDLDRKPFGHKKLFERGSLGGAVFHDE